MKNSGKYDQVTLGSDSEVHLGFPPLPECKTCGAYPEIAWRPSCHCNAQINLDILESLWRQWALQNILMAQIDASCTYRDLAVSNFDSFRAWMEIRKEKQSDANS